MVGHKPDSTRTVPDKNRTEPVVRLLMVGKIGAIECAAANEIQAVWETLERALGPRGGLCLDRIDGGRRAAAWPLVADRAVHRYETWATHWWRRRDLRLDPTLDVVIAAVVDTRPISRIALELNRRRDAIERALVFGLRDYAARARIVGGEISVTWRSK